MCEKSNDLHNRVIARKLNDSQNVFHILMGNHPDHASFQSIIDIWLIAGKYISHMYARALTGLNSRTKCILCDVNRRGLYVSLVSYCIPDECVRCNCRKF